MNKKIKRVQKRVTYQTRSFSIREDIVVFEDGSRETHEVLQAPEGVLILAITQEGKIVLIKEHRHNHGLVYSVPMGRKEESDSNPLESAKRELQEEAGLSAKKWILISTHHNGVHEEGLNYFYIAQELSTETISQDADEDIERVFVSFTDTFKLIDEDKIIDLTSRACIWAGYIYLLRTDSANNKLLEKSRQK